MNRSDIEKSYQKLQELRQGLTSPTEERGVVEKGIEGTSLGRAQPLTPVFEKAHDNRVDIKQPAPERLNSQQIAKDRPGMNGPTPPANVRTEGARQSHNEKAIADKQQTDKHNAEIKARHEKEKSEKMKDERERD